MTTLMNKVFEDEAEPTETRHKLDALISKYRKEAYRMNYF